MNKRIHKAMVSVALASLLLASGGNAQAGIDTFLEEMYMWTSSNPTSYTSQRRSGFVGGSFSARTPIRAINIINISPPAVRVGSCGAIDLHFGAFSHINTEEAIRVMRAIGANALSVAFSIAMQQIAESIYSVIKTYVDRIEALTRHFRNTCEIGTNIQRAIMEGDASGLRSMRDGIGRDICAWKGTEEDINDCVKRYQTDPSSMSEDHGDEIPVGGNMVWRLLSFSEERGGIGDSITNQVQVMMGLTETEAKEFVISMTGTVLLCDSDNSSEEPDVTEKMPLLDLNDLLGEGDGLGESFQSVELEVWRCSDPNEEVYKACCNMSGTGTIRFEGFMKPVQESLQMVADVMMDDNPSSAQRAEVDRFLKTTSLPVGDFLNRTSRMPDARNAVMEVMAQYIAHEYFERFTNNLAEVLRLIGTDTDITVPDSVDKRRKTLLEQAEAKRTPIMEKIEAVNTVDDWITRIERRAFKNTPRLRWNTDQGEAR